MGATNSTANLHRGGRGSKSGVPSRRLRGVTGAGTGRYNLPVTHTLEISEPVYEWTRLHEVVVGRPHYRIVEPFPQGVRDAMGSWVWSTIADKQGQLLDQAFPEIHRRAQMQMDAAAGLLRDRGVTVHRIPPFSPEEDLHRVDDGRMGSMLCFPRDLLLCVGGAVLELSLMNPLRRKELQPLRRLLDALPGPTAKRLRVSMPDPSRSLDTPPFLEGGDCLLLGREVLVGISGRASNPSGAAWLRQVLGEAWQVTEVVLREEVPHLDAALGLVRPGLGVRCPEALPLGLPASLEGWEWIDVPMETARKRLAANVLPLDAGTTLVVEEAPQVAEALARRGQNVVTTPFSGVAWMGGGPRCWSQPLARGA